MRGYLVESYVASARVGEACRRARRAAAVGSGIRYVRTTFLPGDETILHVFEAPSIEALEQAIRLARLPCERVVEAVEAAEMGGA